MQVQVDPLADAMFGLIERELQSSGPELANARLAYFAIAELRRGVPLIWLIESELYDDAFALYHPPLIAHFKRVSDDKVKSDRLSANAELSVGRRVR